MAINCDECCKIIEIGEEMVSVLKGRLFDCEPPMEGERNDASGEEFALCPDCVVIG